MRSSERRLAAGLFQDSWSLRRQPLSLSLGPLGGSALFARAHSTFSASDGLCPSQNQLIPPQNRLFPARTYLVLASEQVISAAESVVSEPGFAFFAPDLTRSVPAQVLSGSVPFWFVPGLDLVFPTPDLVASGPDLIFSSRH